MKTSRIVLIVLLLSCLGAGCVASKPVHKVPKGTQIELSDDIEGLIRQLGDDDWETREKAHRKLLQVRNDLIKEVWDIKIILQRAHNEKMEKQHLILKNKLAEMNDKLYEAKESHDPEVRLRASRILDKVDKFNLTKEDLEIANHKLMEMTRALELFYSDFCAYPEQEPDFSSRALVDALKGDLESDPPKKRYYPFKQDEIGSDGQWIMSCGKVYYYRNNHAENYSSKNPPPKGVQNVNTYDIWAADKYTPEDTTPEEIAEITSIKNWK